MSHSTHITCVFVTVALQDGKPLTVIREHLSGCSDCQEDLQEMFEMYQATGEVWLGSPQLPDGVDSEEKFLEQMVYAIARQIEDEGLSWALLNDKLKDRKVLSLLRLLAQRQTRAMILVSLGRPEYIMSNEMPLIDEAFHELYECMGYRAFWSYFGGSLPKSGDTREEDLKRLIAGWRESLLGARK